MSEAAEVVDASDASNTWTIAYVRQCERLLGRAVTERLGIYALPEGFRLTVIIPVFNEVNTVHRIVQRVRATGLPLEIILVDDGSNDGTPERLAELAGGATEELVGGETAVSDSAVCDSAVSDSAGGEAFAADAKPIAASHVQVRMIAHARNRGKGAAIRTGLEAATGDVVVVQDADLEYNPEDLRFLLQPIVAGEADVVYGSRYGHTDRQISPWWHERMNGLITMLANIAIGLRLEDVETCYKMMRREAILPLIPRLREARFGIEIELTARLARQRLRFAQRRIRYHHRWYDEGKKIGWRDGVSALWCIFYYGLLRR